MSKQLQHGCMKISIPIHVVILFCRSEKQHLKIPFDIEDAKMLGKVLDQYKDMYYFEVMFGVVFVYIL